MAAEMQEDMTGCAEGTAASGAIVGGVEEQAQILLQLMLEQDRQAREDSRAMNARMDQLNERVDRLFYQILGLGSALTVGVAAILIKLLVDG